MGISIWQLLIILAIVLVLFGAKRLRNVGGDLGAAIKGFRSAVKDGEEDASATSAKMEKKEDDVIEGEVTNKEKDKA
ncbi:Sec-independent protein translocase subunit TatA [Kaarinaea lacus]